MLLEEERASVFKAVSRLILIQILSFTFDKKNSSSNPPSLRHATSVSARGPKLGRKRDQAAGDL